jgi:lysyl-tRNA synthetase, class II
VNVTATEIHAKYPDQEKFESVSIAGRIMSRRIMGAASFIELQDATGRIQCYVKRDELSAQATIKQCTTPCLSGCSILAI